jgi:hypothetical protein
MSGGRKNLKPEGFQKPLMFLVKDYLHRQIFFSKLFVSAGNTKGRSISVPLTSCLTGLESALRKLTIFVFICKTDLSKPVKQEVNGTVILPPLVIPGVSDNGVLV